MEVKRKIHDWFGLSYAQYLTVPRSGLQAMRDDWQIKFVELLEEFDDTYDWYPKECTYWVSFKGTDGKFVSITTDPLMKYRYPDYKYIESLKKKTGIPNVPVPAQGSQGTKGTGRTASLPGPAPTEREAVKEPVSEPKEVMIEIVGTDGRVHYRRPYGDKLLLEAIKTEGYSLRISEEGKVGIIALDANLHLKPPSPEPVLEPKELNLELNQTESIVKLKQTLYAPIDDDRPCQIGDKKKEAQITDKLHKEGVNYYSQHTENPNGSRESGQRSAVPTEQSPPKPAIESSSPEKPQVEDE